MILRIYFAIAIVALLLAVAKCAEAHSWYPQECCHDVDCHPVGCETLAENADKIPAEKKAPVEKAVADLKGVLKGGSISEIKAKQEALTKAMDVVTQGMYSQQPPPPGGQPPPGAGFGGTETEDSSSSSGPKANDDGVIDADYTMMDDNKKKK